MNMPHMNFLKRGVISLKKHTTNNRVDNVLDNIYKHFIYHIIHDDSDSLEHTFGLVKLQGLDKMQVK